MLWRPVVFTRVGLLFKVCCRVEGGFLVRKCIVMKLMMVDTSVVTTGFFRWYCAWCQLQGVCLYFVEVSVCSSGCVRMEILQELSHSFDFLPSCLAPFRGR